MEEEEEEEEVLTNRLTMEALEEEALEGFAKAILQERKIQTISSRQEEEEEEVILIQLLIIQPAIKVC